MRSSGFMRSWRLFAGLGAVLTAGGLTGCSGSDPSGDQQVETQPQTRPAALQLTDFRAARQVELDKDHYDQGDALRVTALDGAANKDPKVRESVYVELSIWRGSDKEAMRLTETGPDTGSFASEKPMYIKSKGDPKDGVLNAVPGDVVQVRYADAEDQSIVDGGGVTTGVDADLKPSLEYVTDAPERPVAVILNPGGFRDEVVVNEVVVPNDSQGLKYLEAELGGKLVHDGKVAPVSAQVPKDELRPVADNIGYSLVRVDLDKADMSNLEGRMAAQGFQGSFSFSSKQAMQLTAILLSLAEKGIPATANSISRPDRCPLTSTSERGGHDAFGDDYLDASGIRPLDHFDALGTTEAWQLLDGLGLPDAASTGSADDLWGTVYERNEGVRPAWRPARIAIFDNGFAPNDDWPMPNIGDYYCTGQTYDRFTGTMSTPIDCGGYNGGWGWHGSRAAMVAVGALDNDYGSAGVAGMARGPASERVELMLARHNDLSMYEVALNIRNLVRGGADVISMSFGGECNWWCQTFSRLSGKHYLDEAFRTASSNGVVSVAAAGNDGVDLGHDYWWGNRHYKPCEVPGVICVGAVEHETGYFDAIRAGITQVDGSPHTWSSNFGGGVDIWAPTDIWVRSPLGTTYPPTSTGMRQFGGTSAATPYVAGAMLMIKSMYPPERRDELDNTAANDLLDHTAWLGSATSPAGVVVVSDDRVRMHGGLIHVREMVHRRAAALGFDPNLVDGNEPNDTRADATDAMAGHAMAGVIAPGADVDFFEFRIDDYMHFHASIASATDAANLEIAVVDPGTGDVIGSPDVNVELDPGRYYLRIRDAGSAEPYNCYSIDTTVSLRALAPDVFDDGLPGTPPPGPWPGARNDTVGHRTVIEIPSDPAGEVSSLTFADATELNLDTTTDRDYFEVRVPDDPAAGCSCACGTGFCQKKLVIQVRAEDAVDLAFYAPRGLGWYTVDPFYEGWVRGLGSTYEISIPCPTAETVWTPDGQRQLATSAGGVVFSVARRPDGSRTFYELDLEYQYLQCGDGPSFVDPNYTLDWSQLPWEEPQYFPFPELEVFWDCESNPACDPAEEVVGLFWDGAVHELLFEYASTGKDGAVDLALLDPYGKEIAFASEFQFDNPDASRMPSDLPLHGQLRMGIPGLQSGTYYLRIKGPGAGLLYMAQIPEQK